METHINCFEHSERGEIICKMLLSKEAYEANKENPNIKIGDVDSLTQYIKDGLVVNRPAQKTVLVGTVLTGLPSQCIIQINDAFYECNESTAELDFNLPGSYLITVRAWPYLDAEFTYENQP